VTQHGTTILRRGSFGARGNAAASLDAMLLGSAEWGACACRQMAFGEFGEADDGPVSPARPPSNREFLAIVARRAMRSAFDLYRRFFLLEYWNVGIIDAPVSRVVASGHPTDVHWLPRPPRHCFRADPFAAEDRSDVLMLEEYSYHLGRGWIAALPVHADHAVPRPIVAFAGNLHRSYPYVFAADGAIFCVPECAEDRSVALYRAVSFPDEWRRVGTLIEDFPALDSTIFAHDGRWWLFCTSAAAGCEHKLYAWYSESVTGPWRPHRLNPLKCDITSARPAGRPFLLNGTLCRPAQDCSAGYGSAITLNSVTALTPTCFEERIIGRIEPLPKSEFSDGIHTICAAGDKTIVDGKRLSFDARAAFFKLKGRRLARRIGGTARDAAAIGAETFARVSR
ncbi:MAG: hypothetical protein WA432_05315, partial [Candidatus Babeliaceae bacterium]